MNSLGSEKSGTENQQIRQKLSAMVRGRLLFQREITIDSNGDRRFDRQHLEGLIEIKSQIDLDMAKVLSASATFSLLFYLAGVGDTTGLHIWGVQLSTIPGVLIYLAFLSSFLLVMATVSFMNSQTYSALIDQIILEETKNGLIDVDVFKASLEKEWLIYKIMRRDFSFYAPVHIKMRGVGRFLNGFVYATLIAITTSPFFALMVATPYLSSLYMPDDWIGISIKAFTYICSVSSFLAIVVSNVGFTCDVDLFPPSVDDS